MTEISYWWLQIQMKTRDKHEVGTVLASARVRGAGEGLIKWSSRDALELFGASSDMPVSPRQGTVKSSHSRSPTTERKG